MWHLCLLGCRSLLLGSNLMKAKFCCRLFPSIVCKRLKSNNKQNNSNSKGQTSNLSACHSWPNTAVLFVSIDMGCSHHPECRTLILEPAYSVWQNKIPSLLSFPLLQYHHWYRYLCPTSRLLALWCWVLFFSQDWGFAFFPYQFAVDYV